MEERAEEDEGDFSQVSPFTFHLSPFTIKKSRWTSGTSSLRRYINWWLLSMVSDWTVCLKTTGLRFFNGLDTGFHEMESIFHWMDFNTVFHGLGSIFQRVGFTSTDSGRGFDRDWLV
jgi:hypothetical protein